MSTVIILRDGMPPDQFAAAVLSGEDTEDTVILPLPPSLDEAQAKALVKMLSLYAGEPGVAFVTSGTVGTSKVVVRPYAGIKAEAIHVAFATRMSVNSKVLITTPITHSYGFGIVMAAMYRGASVDVAYSPYVHERASLARLYLNNNDYDIMTGVPFMFNMLLRQPAYHAAERNYAGGEVVYPELQKSWMDEYKVPLLHEYGLSEVGILSFSAPQDPLSSIGFPIPETKVSFDGDELVLDRPGRPISYLSENGEFRNQDIWTPNGVRTGDLGYESGGLLYLSGRAKNVLKVAGKAVACEEIEKAILSFPGMSKMDVVVIGQPHPVRGEVPVAYIAPHMYDDDKSALYHYLSGILPKYKMPWVIRTMEELPRSASSGKVERRFPHDAVPI